jgi:oligopeptide/dipeptide ABC transporter ATP-binding protein
MVFQDPYGSLNPRWRVAEIVEEPLVGYRTTNRAARVRELLDLVGLNPDTYARRRPHELSGGQCQRVAIARAIALDPALVVCDEAVSSLDVLIQAQVLNLFEQLRTELGLSYLFISHDLALVKQVSDRVAVMHLGQLCEIGPAEAIYRAPLHPYTVALLSSIPKLDPNASRERRPVTIKGEPPSPISPPSGCRFRTRCPYAQDRCATEAPVTSVGKPRVRESPLRRMLRLLEALGTARTELNLTEISHRAGIPLSTTHRMAGELVRCGALERSPAGYRIGVRLWEIVALAPRRLGLRELAWPFLEDLCMATGETVLLAVRDGREMVFVEQLPDQGPVLSRRRSLIGGAGGLVLLAYAPAAVQNGEPGLLDVRRAGFAMTAGEVAAPVRDAADVVIAAVSVSATAGADRFVAAVVAAARGISRALGAPSAQHSRRPGGAGAYS